MRRLAGETFQRWNQHNGVTSSSEYVIGMQDDHWEELSQQLISVLNRSYPTQCSRAGDSLQILWPFIAGHPPPPSLLA